MKNSILSCGKNYINRVWLVEHVPLYVLPVSATTLKIMIPDMEYSGIAAGIPVCTLTLL